MKLSSKYLLTAAIAIVTLTGCNSSESEPEIAISNDCPEFTADICGVQTRAVDRSWERGDEIGISGSGRTNVSYLTKDGDGTFSVKTAGDQIYFQNEAEATFTAYYPWKNLTGTTVTISADTKQQGSQKTFDFLWAKATGKKVSPKVSFSFDHKMTKVVFTLKAGDGMSYEEVKSAKVSLDGCRHNGTFNITNGTTTATGTTGAWTFTDFAKTNDAAKTVTYSLILFPQQLASPLKFQADLTLADSKTLSIKADIDFTSANREIDGTSARNEWVAGRQYNLNLILNKTSVSLDKCVIAAWNVVNGEDISVD